LEEHRTEYAVTMRALAAFLPGPPARLLDIGGGPGRYAIALARQGYAVTLADLSAANLAFAREQAQRAGVQLAAVIQANVLALRQAELPEKKYDAVLMLGPLYHLTAAADRRQALQEARQALAENGLLIAAFITRFATFRDLARRAPSWLAEHPDYAGHILETGIHDQAGLFTRAYFAHPAEIIPFMEAAGFETLALAGCEGVVAGQEEGINALSGEAWEQWVELNYRLGQEPSLWGAADHLLYIGKMRTGGQT
jgi:2-polyprenyl-3-methyl-5-hydroxy-6-metoxy-1,4-benzoquinol methylase